LNQFIIKISDGIRIYVILFLLLKRCTKLSYRLGIIENYFLYKKELIQIVMLFPCQSFLVSFQQIQSYYT
ncbi:hypothetical protein, partial [Clostridioides difficile]|uniref:hypothetical protein n=1 Tax=Clostridioides difficile TaxID=1496 RepID=UPI0036E65132